MLDRNIGLLLIAALMSAVGFLARHMVAKQPGDLWYFVAVAAGMFIGVWFVDARAYPLNIALAVIALGQFVGALTILIDRFTELPPHLKDDHT